VKQAIADVLETRKERKFTETIDVAINLRDVDLQNPQKRINDELALPHGRGRPARVAIFARKELAEKAKAHADLLITPEELGDLSNDKRRARKVVDGIDYFPGTGKDRFKDLLNGKSTLPLILYTESYGSSLVEKTLREPTEENLLELFDRMKSSDVFKGALRVARNYVADAIERVRSLPFEAEPVVRLVSEYFDGIFKRLNEMKG
jgi:hypothetical protein